MDIKCLLLSNHTFARVHGHGKVLRHAMHARARAYLSRDFWREHRGRAQSRSIYTARCPEALGRESLSTTESYWMMNRTTVMVSDAYCLSVLVDLS